MVNIAQELADVVTTCNVNTCNVMLVLNSAFLYSFNVAVCSK